MLDLSFPLGVPLVVLEGGQSSGLQQADPARSGDGVFASEDHTPPDRAVLLYQDPTIHNSQMNNCERGRSLQGAASQSSASPQCSIRSSILH